MHRERNHKMNEYITPLQKSAIKQHKKMVVEFKTMKEATIFKDIPWDDNKWAYSRSYNLNFSYQTGCASTHSHFNMD